LKNQHILIAGGGIGGLASALALSQADQRVTVLERAAEFADIGAGIQLGPNAIKVLAQWGVKASVLQQACLPEAIAVRDTATGRSLSRMLLGQTVQQRYGEVYACMHRADLHAALLQAVRQQSGVQLHCDEAVLSATQSGDKLGGVAQSHPVGSGANRNSQSKTAPSDQGATAPCSNITVPRVQVQSTQHTWQADALVAADGVASSVRQAVWADGPPRATGHAAYRTLLPIASLPASLRTHALASEVGVWWGPDVHVVHYPVRGGEFINLVVLSEQAAAEAVPGWAAVVRSQDVERSVQTACPALRALLACASSWHSWHLYDRPSARSWIKGHIALLGDAAHPMLPYLAQGAAMALEDAAALARSAAAHSHWPAALHHYQSLRKARCERVVATARRNGRIFHLAPPWSVARDAVLALKGTQVVGMPWLYGA
jgi:salicylate hydroxylase